MKCIVVDDEPLARQLLGKYINKQDGIELAATCTNALEAFQKLNEVEVDLMFLDIRMPGISGLDFLKSLKKPPITVLTSAYNEYAVDGFELEVADYLLKPITYERFEKCIAKIQRRDEVEVLAEVTHTYFKVSRELVKVEHRDLYCIQSIKDYVLVKTTKGNYISYMTMKALEELLPNSQFFRIHRSYIVNLDFVQHVKKSSVVVDKEELPLSEASRTAFLKKLS